MEKGFVMGGRKRRINHLVDSMVAELSDVVRTRGYAPTGPLAPGLSEDAAWFVAETGDIAFTRSVVRIDIGWFSDGTAIVNGGVALMSDEVADALRTVPPAAELRGAGADYQFHSFVDRMAFTDFSGSEATDRAPRVTRTEDVTTAVDWVTRKVTGPAADWFADRDSVAKLVGVARTPLPGRVPERVDPVRLRAIVVLCILNGRFLDAAALMTEHLHRDHAQPNMDSSQRVSAFDAHLRQRFPAYAAHRQS